MDIAVRLRIESLSPLPRFLTEERRDFFACRGVPKNTLNEDDNLKH
jgi:hypothetical protein